VSGNQRKRLTYAGAKMAREKAPAAFNTDRSALPTNPVDSTVLRMQTMGAGNGVTSRGSLGGGHLTE
jgi:hypothetical protein